MFDWSSLGQWVTPDIGIGAVGGAIITGTVALLVDQRRRSDESRNRFSEEKLRAYQRLIAEFEVIGEFLLLCGEFPSLFRKYDRGEELNSAEIEMNKVVDARYESMFKKWDQYVDVEESVLERSLLTSHGSARAANRLMKLLEKIEAKINAGDYESVSKFALRYEAATAILVSEVRADLGIRQ